MFRRDGEKNLSDESFPYVSFVKMGFPFLPLWMRCCWEGWALLKSPHLTRLRGFSRSPGTISSSCLFISLGGTSYDPYKRPWLDYPHLQIHLVTKE